MSILNRHPKIAAFLSSMFVPGTMYLAFALFLGSFAIWFAIISILIFGFWLGKQVSNTSRQTQAVRITIAALIGLAIPWLLLVIVTQGFALVGAPLLLAYGAAVHFGQRSVLTP